MIGLLLMTGCSDENPEAPVVLKVNVAGKVFQASGYEDIFKPGAAVQDAYVDLYRIQENGTLEKISKNSVKSGTDGKFQIEAEISGDEEYILQARKGNQVWKSIVNISPKNEITYYAFPFTAQTTAGTEIFIEARKKQKNLDYYDISVSVDQAIAGLIKDNPNLVSEAADMIDYTVNARTKALMNSYFSADASQIALFNNMLLDQQMKYARDLYFASSLNAVKNLSNINIEFLVDALVNSGLDREKCTRLDEIFYRILISNDSWNDDFKNSMVRNAAYSRARIINNSVLAGFHSLNRTFDLNEIKSAADRLFEAVKTAENYGQIKSAYARYHAAIRGMLLRVAGINGSAVNLIDRKVESAVSRLRSELNAASDPEDIIQAYANFYTVVIPDIKSLLKNMYEQDADTIADMIVMGHLNF